MAPLLFAATIGAVLRQDMRRLGRSWGVFLPVSMLAGYAVVELTKTGLDITDGISVRHPVRGHAQPGHVLVRAISLGIIASINEGILSILLSLLIIAGCLAIWLELVVRAAAIELAVFFMPLALAGLVWPATAHWAKRLVEVLVALLLMKPVIVGALCLGAGAVVDVGDPSTAVSGLAILLIAAFAPYALLKLVPIVGVSAIAHLEGLSRQPIPRRRADRPARLCVLHPGRGGVASGRDGRRFAGRRRPNDGPAGRGRRQECRRATTPWPGRGPGPRQGDERKGARAMREGTSYRFEPLERRGLLLGLGLGQLAVLAVALIGGHRSGENMARWRRFCGRGRRPRRRRPALPSSRWDGRRPNGSAWRSRSGRAARRYGCQPPSVAPAPALRLPARTFAPGVFLCELPGLGRAGRHGGPPRRKSGTAAALLRARGGPFCLLDEKEKDHRLAAWAGSTGVRLRSAQFAGAAPVVPAAVPADSEPPRGPPPLGRRPGQPRVRRPRLVARAGREKVVAPRDFVWSFR